ncbi:MAG: DUF3786 domain-containing protein [Thermodesulfobacteriota bacterium]|nr:DUF3786 domain-containing protein [Thermodesulfobacteriota bacterium]
MAQLNNVMDVLEILDGSNCRQCNEKTCMAFAAAVFKGNRQLSECPKLDQETIEQYEVAGNIAPTPVQEMEAVVANLQKEIAKIDLAERADAVGGVFANNRLIIKIFGKDFHIYPDGRISSEIHMIPWVTIPVLTYVLYSKGLPVSGEWMPFRELKDGAPRNGLFVQRCEAPLKQLADRYTNLFENMVDIFNGRQVENHYQSDIAIVLWPLPKVPVLVCYWKPDEEGLDSSLNLFFDKTVTANLGIDALYSIAAGIVMMFEKLALRHGVEIEA